MTDQAHRATPADMAGRRQAPAQPPTPTQFTTHEPKTSPAYFQQVWVGLKTFEVRYDDRGFQRGDVLVLLEWDRHWPCQCENGHDTDCARYTGRSVTAEVGHVTASTPHIGNRRGFIGNGYVVMSLCNPKNHAPEERRAAAEGRP